MDGGADLDDDMVDLAVVRGLPRARRALEVAAAGGHHRPAHRVPGTGKTALARADSRPSSRRSRDRPSSARWAALDPRTRASHLPNYTNAGERITRDYVRS
jgi:Magnesium chelatase, subunit ChlI